MVPLTTEPSPGSPSSKDTVDGSEILRSPVEGQVVHPIIYMAFLVFLHPFGGLAL